MKLAAVYDAVMDDSLRFVTIFRFVISPTKDKKKLLELACGTDSICNVFPLVLM